MPENALYLLASPPDNQYSLRLDLLKARYLPLYHFYFVFFLENALFHNKTCSITDSTPIETGDSVSEYSTHMQYKSYLF